MFSKRKILFFAMSIICLISCTNNPTSSKKPQPSELKVDGNTIVLVSDVNEQYVIQVTVDDKFSYDYNIMANKKIPSIAILKGNKDFYNDIALLLAKQNGSIKVRLNIPEIQDTIVDFHIDVNETNELSSNVLNGVCAAASSDFDAQNVEADIIRWLYRKHENNLSDSTINVMRLYLKELNKTTYKEYITSDPIPKVASLKGIEYLISSNMVADHYYLFACQSEKDIEEFVEEMVSLKFEAAVASLSDSIPCYRGESTSGLACITLVGINNDWSYQIVPVGLICIDNRKPIIRTNRNPIETNDNSIPNQITFEGKKIRITSKTKSPIVTGEVSVSYGTFEGFGYMISVPFTFSFSGDIKSIIVHKTKTSEEIIDLNGKTSPYHSTISVGLDTGDNYIPIDAIDACGNKSTLDLNITTERIERNPVIENNIYN